MSSLGAAPGQPQAGTTAGVKKPQWGARPDLPIATLSYLLSIPVSSPSRAATAACDLAVSRGTPWPCRALRCVARKAHAGLHCTATSKEGADVWEFSVVFNRVINDHPCHPPQAAPRPPPAKRKQKTQNEESRCDSPARPGPAAGMGLPPRARARVEADTEPEPGGKQAPQWGGGSPT